MKCRGVRGATIIQSNDKEGILRATRELMALIVRINEIDVEDIASVLLTTTPDLDQVFPALGARQIFGSDIPVLCAREIKVPAAIEKCIRILMHWNTDKGQNEILPVYINGAERLLAAEPPEFDRETHDAWVSENCSTVKQEMQKLNDQRRASHQ
ncbi:MAG: chorismate mutase [Pirellulales bacterium]